MPSLNLSLYGDDWLSIYNCFAPYYTHTVFPTHTSPLPGVLAYLAPYGPTNCSIGLMYNLFKTNYQWYYIVSLFLKIFASFSLFLLSEAVLGSKKKIFALLSAVLFLVGFTGIENTDWAVYMIVYFAVALFILSLFYKHKFLISKKSKYLIISFFLMMASLISCSIRLFPIIVVVPVMDLLILYSGVYKFKHLSMIIYDCIFIVSVIILWLAGLFGTGTLGKNYSPGNWSLSDFTNFIAHQPIQATKTFLHLIAVIIIPDKWTLPESIFILVGILIIYILMKAVIHFRLNKTTELLWLVIVSVSFFIFLLSMWYFSPSRLMGSGERYLILPFTIACFFIAVLSSQSFFSTIIKKRLLFLIIIFLIFTHWMATETEYSNLLSHGRNYRFVNQFDKLLFHDISIPVTSKKYIYLNFDDAFTEHSILFGLGFKILVLSGEWNTKYNPEIFDEKTKLFEATYKESVKGVIPPDTLKDVFSYRLKEGSLTDATSDIRSEITTSSDSK